MAHLDFYHLQHKIILISPAWLRKYFFSLFLPILAKDWIHSNYLSLSERLHWTGRSNWKLGLQQTGETGAAQAAVEADRSNNARNWSCSNHAIHKHMPDREGVWWDPAGIVKSWYLPSFASERCWLPHLWDESVPVWQVAGWGGWLATGLP